MTEIFSNEKELIKALEVLQTFINNKSENDEKTIKALEIYNKIKIKQKQYQLQNLEKFRENSRKYHNKNKDNEEYKQHNRDKMKIQYKKKTKNFQKMKDERDNKKIFNLLPNIIE